MRGVGDDADGLPGEIGRTGDCAGGLGVDDEAGGQLHEGAGKGETLPQLRSHGNAGGNRFPLPCSRAGMSSG